MKVRDHIILGGVLSAGLYPVLGVKCLALWASSVFIDADHYLEFLYHNGLKNFSLRGAITFHSILANWLKEAEFINLSLFHTAECMLSVYILSLWLDSLWLKALFYGLVFHVLLDTVHFYSLGIPFKRVFSIVEFKIRKDIMKRNGLCPWVLYKKASDLTDRRLRYYAPQ